MTTNQEWLFSLTLKEYLEWMESEHSEPNPECSAMLYKMFTENMKHEPCNDYEPKDDVSGYGADFNVAEPNFGNVKAVEMDASRLVVREPDSREKLEADVRKHYAYSTTTLMYPPSANKTTDMLSALPVDTVIGWLDRQAAITERENLASRLDSYELATMIDATIKERNELKAKLAETRELLSQAHLDWLNDVGEYEEIIDKLKADLNTAVCDNNSLRYELTCLAERDIDDTPKYCPNCGAKVVSE